ncbi:MAG: hypothetical protein L6R37_004716 [Teloschistes peruensis]|nr:MAG: hypothetical protein L6R37_004716 [Teloschistes peruensis]
MAFQYANQVDWHDGEHFMHNALQVPYFDNPTSPFLTPYAARFLPNAPLLALGTIDDAGRPWTTILGGEAGFVRPLGQSNIGIRTLVVPEFDPVINTLFGGEDGNGSVPLDTKNRLVAGLAIDLATRSRIKLAGKMVAGVLDRAGDEMTNSSKATEAQIVIRVEQSLGNCPKYLNKKQIIPTLPEPALVSDSLPLPPEAIDLLARADLFFISTVHGTLRMGNNHRGGPPGFVRVAENNDLATTLVYPEYSGNRFYQSLGNLRTDPKAGIVIPDLESGDVLYVTGTTEILIGKEAAALLPRSNLAVKVRILGGRFIRRGLTFRAIPGEPSPYNPPVRFLATERAAPDAQSANKRIIYAKLIKKELLTSSIGRFRFSVSDAEAAGRWQPGQYVALAFEDELGAGYIHMRDDDPSSLNDDLVRTFTVSSSMHGNLPDDEFEITIRNVGKVTSFLFRQNIKAELEIPLKGIAGTFTIHQPKGEVVPFVAGGIGITPLLAHLPQLVLGQIRLFWAIRAKDIGLAIDTFERFPRLGKSTIVYIPGGADDELETVPRLREHGAQTFPRRMLPTDIQGLDGLSNTWYVCAGTEIRQAVVSWLSGKEVVYEDFNY